MALELVSPSEPTPSGHLPLSVAEDTLMMKSYIELILVFGEGKEPAKVIREGLAKALVPYYPVAGRLVPDSENVGRLRVALTGEGVPFIEASVDCTLQDVNYVQQQPLMIPQEQLLPFLPEETDHSVGIPYMMQVTQFNCGGFTVGIKFNHTMFDGMGAGQFTVAMGEMARGLGEPTIKPVWCRESIPGCRPTLPNMPDLQSSDGDGAGAGANLSVPIAKPPSGDVKLERCMTDLSLDYINQLSDQFMGETGERCTTFEIAVAKLWQCRTRVIDLQPDVTVTLIFPVNVRRLLNGILPSDGTGYYGNCVCAAAIEAPSEQIASASLVDIVKLIKQGKESVTGKYRKMLEGVEPPPVEAPTYDKLFVLDWRRLGFSDTDYGWGTPNYVVPLPEQLCSLGWACLVKSPPPMKGIRLKMLSVVEEHSEAFLNGMNDCS